jgi:hypothetical protein
MKAYSIDRSLLATLKRAFVAMQHYLEDLASRSPDVQIWQKPDRSGQSGWHGYDPISGDYVCFSSEDEIRSWLEQRYYTRDRDF